MKKTITIFAGVLLLVLAAGLSFADSIVVSQVDNSQLLAGQIIRVYVSVTDKNGVSIPGLQNRLPDHQFQFRVFEDPLGSKTETERPIIDILSGANTNDGINILFLVDNSGSMYTNMAGQETNNAATWRMTFTKQAINNLLPNIKNPADRLALLSFNVKADTDIPLTDDKATIQKALTEIQRPSGNARYTELYESLYYAVTKMSHIPGRKVIILLSDGENFPYTPPKGQAHPQFAVRHGLSGAIDLAQREGISVFTLGIGNGAFQNTLREISNQTGGVSYQVQDLAQLKELYSAIQKRVLSEYLITYFAGMEPAERKTVKVKLTRSNDTPPGSRPYYSATLFGKPQDPLAFWIFAFLLLALLLLFLLWLLKVENRKQAASLEVLSVGGKKSRIQPVTIMESQHEVTISGDADADLTISGDAKLANSEVKLYKEGSDYTVMSAEGTIKVNNQPVKAKKLRSGDLITVGNTTIVFDGGNLKRDPTKLMEKTKTSRLKGDDKKRGSTKTPHN
jgi:Ca-activated chloride channel family protein